MADTTTDTQNVLDMSDEDIMNMSEPPVVADVPAVVVPDAVDTPVVVDAPVVADETNPLDEDDEAGEDDGDKPADETTDVVVPADKTPTPAADAKPDAVVPAKDATPATEKPADVVAVDYEAEYKRLIAPFKANGRDIAINSVDDAIALMQMGANYNKKMAGLKPNLRLMKMLENNGVLTEEKLSFLIELDKKNPEAINKLVKDSGLNPMDFDADKAGEYKPKIHSVDDREMALDTVLDQIQDTPTYTRTLEIVSKQWDGASKQVIAKSPELLGVINEHVRSGIYDLISTEVERERVFGRLNGMSDLEAYRQIGDAMNARGGFNHLGSSQGKPAAPVVVVQPKPKTVDDDALKDKRRAASSTKPATPAPAGPGKDFNPLALSDEEFTKATDGRFR